MAKRKKESKPTPAPRQYAHDEVNQYGDYIKIGGSPVPGLTLRHVLRGHTGVINRIAWSPDGKYLASPSGDETIRIWDMSTGECIRVLEGHTNMLCSVAWSPDGGRLASTSGSPSPSVRENVVNIWNIQNGKNIANLEGHTYIVWTVAWSPDGQYLASGSGSLSRDNSNKNENVVIIWNAETFKSTSIFREIDTKVTNVSWSLDGKMLAAASQNSEIYIYNAVSATLEYSLKGHTGGIFGIAWLPNSRLLASAGHDKTIRIWDIDSQKSLQILEEHSSGIKCLSFSNSGGLLSSKDFTTIRLWNCSTWACIAAVNESSSEVASFVPSIAFHPHLPILATLGERDRIIRIWELDEAVLLGQAKENINYTTAKLVLVGDSGVGKTGLGWRLAHGEFKEHASTHGQQFWSIPQLGLKRKDGADCEAVLWDLAGQHVYRQVHSIFLDNVSAALVLFDPTNRQEPLKGAQFWLEQLRGKGQLPPTVLVGARVDRGAPALSQAELDQFCQCYGITGGYISTSALKGDGLAELLDLLKKQIPWDDMTATVTTTTFKRIKDYVLSLKEKTDRKGVLVSPAELRALLETSEVSETSEAWEFTDAEMMTAVGHLETHGYVSLLHNSAGEQFILLTPDLLVNLAASIMLLADKNARELGAVSETELLQGKYPFEELKGLEKAEQQILIDAAVLRFLEHNICFRETFNNDTLLIFPSLIKQKRPLQDDIPSTDDISYVVRGRVENLYASLVVLLGYTSSFSRINQWQNQAQYEMREGEICGFRSIEEREGELELVLYYGDKMPSKGREQFQELFEQFLYQREVEVTRFPPAVCPKGHPIERTTFISRLRENQKFVFCYACDDKVPLPEMRQEQTIGIGASPWLQREEGMARLRSAYEKHLTNIKSYRRGWAAPRVYLSHLPEQKEWAKKLVHDLQDAGVYVIENLADLKDDDFAIILDTPAYQKAFLASAPVLGNDPTILRARLGKKKKVLSLACEGKPGEHNIRQCTPGDFCDETHYAVSLFDLVLNLYAIPLTHKGFEPLRQALHTQWEQTLAKYAGAQCAEIHETEKETQKMDYQDFQVLVTEDRRIRASSEQGDEWSELHLDLNKIKLALSLIEKRQTDADLLKGLGGELYQALFPNAINARWHATRAGAESAGCGVRLRLVCEPPELAALPWEFLYDERTNTFLASDVQTVLSRYLDVPQSKRPLGSASRPLRILLVISSPTNLPRLDVAGEEALIREALAAHIDGGQIELDVVREATIRNLTQQLRLKPYNVFHFIGHGDFQNNVGMMALIEPDGKKRLLDEESFANLFLGNRDIGLAVLNSCRGAQASSYRAMTGVAPRLVQRGLPAVVAMQYSILDTTAKQFADEFYRTLALGWPVDAAIQSTRNAISIEVGTDKPDFATPVLYMRTKDGVIMRGS